MVAGLALVEWQNSVTMNMTLMHLLPRQCLSHHEAIGFQSIHSLTFLCNLICHYFAVALFGLEGNVQFYLPHNMMETSESWKAFLWLWIPRQKRSRFVIACRNWKDWQKH